MNLGVVPYGEAWELQRSLAGAVSQGAIPDTIAAAGAPADGHDWTAHRGGRAAHPGGRRGRGRRDRPRRQVDLPRAGAARLLPDLRPEAARPGRQALLPRARGGADPHAREARRRGRADRRAHRRLADAAAAQDRLHRDPHRQVGDDARLRAQRRPRPGAVHASGSPPAGSRTRRSRRSRASSAVPSTVDEVRARRARGAREVFEPGVRGAAGRRRPWPLAAAGARPARRPQRLRLTRSRSSRLNRWRRRFPSPSGRAGRNG